MMPPTKLLTVPEAAQLRDVHPGTVRRWISLGWLPAQRVGARLWLIRPADLDRCQPPGVGTYNRKAARARQGEG